MLIFDNNNNYNKYFFISLNECFINQKLERKYLSIHLLFFIRKINQKGKKILFNQSFFLLYIHKIIVT